MALGVKPDSLADPENFTVGAPKPMRALKIWTLMKGVGGAWFQNLVTRSISFAKLLEELLEKDGRFEVFRVLALVCARLKGEGEEVDILN